MWSFEDVLLLLRGPGLPDKVLGSGKGKECEVALGQDDEVAAVVRELEGLKVLAGVGPVGSDFDLLLDRPEDQVLSVFSLVAVKGHNEPLVRRELGIDRAMLPQEPLQPQAAPAIHTRSIRTAYGQVAPQRRKHHLAHLDVQSQVLAG